MLRVSDKYHGDANPEVQAMKNLSPFFMEIDHPWSGKDVGERPSCWGWFFSCWEGVVYGNPIPIRTITRLEPNAYVIRMGTAFKGNGFPGMGQERIRPKRDCNVLSRLPGVMGMDGIKIRSPMDWKLGSVWKRKDTCWDSHEIWRSVALAGPLIDPFRPLM